MRESNGPGFGFARRDVLRTIVGASAAGGLLHPGTAGALHTLATQNNAGSSANQYNNRFYGCLEHGDTVGNSIFTASKPAGMRFKAERGGNVTGFRWHLRVNTDPNAPRYSAGDGGSVTVELRKALSDGAPDLSGNGLLASTRPNNGESSRLIDRPDYVTWNFVSSAAVSAGTDYYLYFKQRYDDRYVSINAVRCYQRGTGGPYWGSALSFFEMYRSSRFTGWVPDNLNGLFSVGGGDLYYSDGVVTGPGSGMVLNGSEQRIGGSRLARQRFTVKDYSRTVDALWLRVWRFSSSGRLLVRLGVLSGGVLDEASVPASQVVLGGPSSVAAPWVRVPLSKPIQLVNGQSYAVTLSSPSGSYGTRALIAAKTYGGKSRNIWRYAWSEIATDGGQTWKGWPDPWGKVINGTPGGGRLDCNLSLGFEVA